MKVRIPVTVTYAGFYEFDYEDTLDMDKLMDEELEASPENKETHWEAGLKKLKGVIREEIEEYGVYDALTEKSIKCNVVVGLGPTEEQKLRKIFDKGYAELEEDWRPLEDEEDDCEEAA
jgi:hypothetical protein